MGHVFVSYSRAEFYYAESITAVINQSGRVRAWLDVENLRPGTDWAATIDSALDSAGALLLMASPAALASPYVRAEWTRALAAGKPVHVAMVRTVSLPPQLAHCPQHDLRGRFWSRSRDLARELNGQGRGTSGAIPRRPAVPFPILLLVALLCAGFVMSWVAALSGWDAHGRYADLAAHEETRSTSMIFTRYARFFLALMVGNVVVAGGLIAVFVRLLNRRATPSSLRQAFGAMFIAMVFDQVTAELTANTSIRLLYVATMVAAAAGAALVSWSRTVHLWMPVGEGAHYLRERILRRVSPRLKTIRNSHAYQWRTYRPRFAALGASLAGVGSAASYDIVHHPADQTIANVLARACDSAGFVRDNVDPGWTFVMVSDRSDWRMLAQAQAMFGDRAVFVLASSVRPPPGIDVDAELIRRSQWLDFRDQGPVALYEFLRSAVSTEPGPADPAAVPASMERFHGPKYLRDFVLVAQLATSVVVTPALGQLIAGSSTLVDILPFTLIAALLVGLLLRLAWLSAIRRITPAQWRRHAWLIIAGLTGWAVLFPITSAVPVAIQTILGLILRIQMPVLLALRLPAYSRAFRLQWLPPAATTETTSPVTPRLFSFPLIAVIAAFTTGFVFIAPLPGA